MKNTLPTKIKAITILFLIGSASGCQTNLNRAMEDYSGADSAKIRVLDKGVLSARIYDKIGDCYKPTGIRRLTSFFMLSLVNQGDTTVSSSKKINMKHPSSFGNASVNEYVIPAGKLLGIINRAEDVSYSGKSSFYESINYFMPEVDHEYQISAEYSKYNSNPNSATVVDLSTNKSATLNTEEVKFCP